MAAEVVCVVLHQMWSWRLHPAILGLLAVILIPLWLVLTGSAAQAQSFDCTKARTAVETAICADASLKAQDVQLAQAYARLLAAMQAREPEKAAQLRDEQRRWVQERERSCGTQGEAPARITACIAEF